MENRDKPTMELLDYKLTQLQAQLAEVLLEVKENLVGRKEFDIRVGRLETIIYSVIGIMGTALIGALITLVIKL